MIETPYFIALDPGTRTGWASFNEDGKLISRGVYTPQILYIMMHEGWKGVHTLIVENFRLFPGASDALIMNTFPAVKIIGAIEYAAHIRGWEIVMQEPQAKDTPLMWLGYHYSKKSHVPDDKSAHAHGVQYLTTIRLITVDEAREAAREFEEKNKGKARS